MKKIFHQNKSVINKAFLLLAAVIGYCYAYTQPRYHFIAPAAVINTNFPGHTNVTAMPLPGGYDIVEITAANQARFLPLAPTRIRYVYEQMQNAASVLRTKLNEVYQVSSNNVPVNYYLVDDRTGVDSVATGNFTVKILPNAPDGRVSDGRYHIWPSGNGIVLTGGTFMGKVRLGEYQMDFDQATSRPGGIAALHELVLHETFHTQLVGRWTKWPGYLTYGADRDHYIDELLGDQESPLNEGFGTFYGYTINPAAAANLERFFTLSTRRYVVEARSFTAAQPEIVNVPGRTQRTIRGHNYFEYTWMEIPHSFNFYNENNFTGFMYYYWLNANGNRDVSLGFIRQAANSMWSLRDTLKRYPSYVVNRLALRMEEYNANAGRADATRTSSMFPFAMFDLISHFSYTDAQYRADYGLNYPDRSPRAYTEYFNHRAAIRQLVQADIAASPIRFTEAVRKIKEYCMRPANIW
jgi:hypothetical protein